MRRLAPLIPLGLSLVFVISWFGQGVDAQGSGGGSPPPKIVLGSPIFRTPSTASGSPTEIASPTEPSVESPSPAASPVTQQLCVSVTGIAPATGWTVAALVEALLAGTATLTDLQPPTGCAPLASPGPIESPLPSAFPTVPPLPSAFPTVPPLPSALPTVPPLPTSLLTFAPIATPVPTAAPTPSPTQNSAVQQPGTIWFGTSTKGGVLRGHRSTFRPGQQIAVSALFSQSPNATKITLTLFTGSNDRVVFSQQVTIGVQWEGLAITIVRPLSAGRYHLQISHGGTLLSDGRFSVR